MLAGSLFILILLLLIDVRADIPTFDDVLDDARPVAIKVL